MATTMTEVRGRLIFNSTLIRDYVCQECYGGLKEIWVGGDDPWRVVCAEHPEHEGFIKSTTACLQQRQAEYEAQEVLAAYPHLSLE